MTHRFASLGLCALMCGALLAAGLAQAQVQVQSPAPSGALRDPTEPPPGARRAINATDAGVGATAEAGTPQQLVFSEGRGYVFAHGRRYAVGEEFDGQRIERIEPDAVWLRGPAGVQRRPLYAGVQRQASAATDAARKDFQIPPNSRKHPQPKDAPR